MPRRLNESLLQPLERPTLLWLARRMPAWVTPDRLTAFGFVGVLIAAAGYGLWGFDHNFLWLVLIGIPVNWFGDSLDGTLARVRGIERPRYGFYLDQGLDAIAQMLAAVAVGVSGLMRFEIAMLTLATYYLMSILSLLRAVVSSEFVLNYGKIGPTELRVAFMAMIPVLYVFPPTRFSLAGFQVSYYELLTLLWAVTTAITFFFTLASYSHQLAREETAGIGR